MKNEIVELLEAWILHINAMDNDLEETEEIFLVKFLELDDYIYNLYADNRPNLFKLFKNKSEI